MKLCSQTQWQRGLALFCAIGAAVAINVTGARADQWDKKTILTVNEPIQVTDKLLDPGKYVFKLVDSSSDRHIVQIFDSDQSHLISTVMAIPNYRIQPTGSTHFTFWETPPGTAKAMRAWFYPGDNYGQEFRYPKQPVVLQAAVTAPSSSAISDTAIRSATNGAENRSVQQSAPAAEPTSPPPQTPEEPREVAQNNPPPAPAPAAQPAPQEQPKPEELPKTASPYPALGLGGLALIGLSGLLRLKRVS
jgi:LPXTG-motif cell wall-anchored protein